MQARANVSLPLIDHRPGSSGNCCRRAPPTVCDGKDAPRTEAFTEAGFNCSVSQPLSGGDDDSVEQERQLCLTSLVIRPEIGDRHTEQPDTAGRREAGPKQLQADPLQFCL
ncbi:MAG: hypothetical protein QOF90_3626 [Acetobacteraceae bacterium]|nr:hypothetical protein [Acetobacteraceae bacterium]